MALTAHGRGTGRLSGDRRQGVCFAWVGILASLRDFGRLGQIMLDAGEFDGKRSFPLCWWSTFTKAVIPRNSAASRRSRTAATRANGGSFAMIAVRGVHGQTIYVEPTAKMVLVRFASYPQAQNGFIDPTSLPAYQAAAEYLMSR